MICSICNSSEFTVHDGIFYCTECSTQIEETRDEQTDDFSFSRRSLVSSPATVKIPKRQKKTTYGPWIIAEAYNFILYLQVSALIELGASPKLKNTILHIWTKYLQKCEIAFRTDYRSAECTPRLGVFATKRDLNVLYGDKMRIKKCKKGKEIKKLKNSTMVECTTSDDQSSNTDSDVSSTCKFNVKHSSHVNKLLRKGKQKKDTFSDKVHNMNLAKTLSFCYLGLLYTEDQLSLLDFIRFVYEERVPYINIIDKLPPSMDIQRSDINTLLTYIVPDAHAIYEMSLEIAKFLNLPKFKEPSISLAVAHYVKELNLPDDLLPMVKILVEQFKEQSSNFPSICSKKVPHEYLAISFIIVVLKMLFVLDNKFEIEHSEIMKKFNAINPEHKYFVWTEWKEQALLREFLFVPENSEQWAVNKIDSLNADRIISKYPYTQLKPPSNENLLSCRNNLTSKYAIKEMLANIVHIPSSISRMPTSFPLKREINCFKNEWRTLKMYQETKDIDFTILNKDFSSYSLSFNPLHFDSEEDELQYLLLTSLYLPEKATDMRFSLFQYILSEHDIIRTSSKYWFFDSKQRVSTDALLEWLNVVPVSFKWLITYICKYAHIKHTVLYKEITTIEKVLFLNVTKLSKNKLDNVSNKIKVD